MASNGYILAVDFGTKRVGLATASEVARLASPLKNLVNDEKLLDNLTQIIQDEEISKIVVGLPIDMGRRETEQTRLSRDFAQQLKKAFDLPVYLIDETLSSARAESELRSRGEKYARGDIDALAATLILEDFLNAKDDDRDQLR